MDGVKGEETSVKYPEEALEILSKRDDDDDDIKEDEFEIACDSDTRRRAGGLGIRKEVGGIFVRECVIMKEKFKKLKTKHTQTMDLYSGSERRSYQNASSLDHNFEKQTVALSREGICRIFSSWMRALISYQRISFGKFSDILYIISQNFHRFEGFDVNPACTI